MIGRFEALARCDGPNGCDVLVEPHVARCFSCSCHHGPSPAGTGERGHAASEAKPKKKRKPKGPKVAAKAEPVVVPTNGGGWIQCCGVHGAMECSGRSAAGASSSGVRAASGSSSGRSPPGSGSWSS